MKKYILILIAVLSLVSCRKDAPVDWNNPLDNIDLYTWDQVFESYWQGLNYNYAFWDIDPTDWNQVYREYKPKFEQLDEYGLNDEDINDQAMTMFHEMSSTLIDHHFTATFSVDVNTVSNMVDPGEAEVMKRDYYHPNIWYESTELGNVTHQSILKDLAGSGFFDAQSVMHNFDMSDQSMRIFLGYIESEGIVYLTLNSFAILSNLQPTNPVGMAMQAYAAMLELPDLKGVILDVRGNGGGAADDIHFFLGRLIPQSPFTVMETRSKNGPGRYDFDVWVPMNINDVYFEGEDIADRTTIDVPVVILSDIYSISMAEISSMSVKALPNGTMIGERTYGGHGPLLSANGSFPVHYCGGFSNKVISVITSHSMSRNLDGEILEGIGVTPDIECLLDVERWKNGEDNQLERAVQFIKTGE